MCHHLCLPVIFGVEKVSATERNTMRDSILEQNWKGDSLNLDGNAAVALKNGTNFKNQPPQCWSPFRLHCVAFDFCANSLSLLLVLEAMRKWTIGRMRWNEGRGKTSEWEREKIWWWTTGEISYFLTGYQSQKIYFFS